MRQSCRPSGRSRRSRPTSSTRSPSGWSGSGPDRHRRSRCPRPRTHADLAHARRRDDSALRVALAVCDRVVASNTTAPLRTSTTAERVRVAVRVDTNRRSPADLQASGTDLQPSVGGHELRCRSGDGNRGRQDCDGSRLTTADRLLIRPASGRQAGTGLSARTHHWKDTATASHSKIESRAKSTDTNLTTAPDGTPHTLTVRECPPTAGDAYWSKPSSTCSSYPLSAAMRCASARLIHAPSSTVSSPPSGR